MSEIAIWVSQISGYIIITYELRILHMKRIFDPFQRFFEDYSQAHDDFEQLLRMCRYDKELFENPLQTDEWVIACEFVKGTDYRGTQLA